MCVCVCVCARALSVSLCQPIHALAVIMCVCCVSLNRNIRRIIFHSLTKYNGNEFCLLSSGHVKQIAGRAGRYGQDHTHGEVTT